MPEHPSLQMHVTTEQRDRAEDFLKDAYAEGRISESEFDRRIGQVIGADNRKELNEAFYGLVHVPAPSQSLGVHPAYQTALRPEARDQAGRGVGALAHLLPLPLVGPGVIYGLSSPGTFARREAAKAFNFTLVSILAMIASVVLAGVTNLEVFDMITGLIFVGSIALAIVGGAKAARGEDWKNPVKHVVKLEVLSER